MRILAAASTIPVRFPRRLGKALMYKAIEECERLFGRQLIKIGAQLYLERFYQSFGFQQCGDHYLEDGIPHIEMTRLAEQK